MLTEQIRLAKVNVREEPLVAKLFGIDAIPSYVILQSRDVVDAFKGLTSIEALAADIQALLDENTGGDLRSSSRPES